MTDAAIRVAYRARSAMGGPRDVRLSSRSPKDDGAALFFDGFVTPGEQTAQALLLVAKVARTRFHTPPGALTAARAADPVVTSNGDRLRFESFSACGGVAARLDVLPGGLEPGPLAPGTTNVDVNSPLRAALAGVRGLDPLHLAVGTDVTVTTLETAVVEPKVPLPDRWVRGFAESQAVAARLVERARLTTRQAGSFVRSLPTASSGRSVAYATTGRDGLRLTSRPAPEAVPVGGPSRLRVIAPILRHATGLRVYGPAEAGPGASCWQVDLEEARLSLTLSPAAMRGFSGEGGLLHDLLDERATEDSARVSALLDHDHIIDVMAMARRSGLPPARVERALSHLAASGRVGFDLAEGAYFHRELPWRPERLEKDHPRLAGARRLVADGAVRVDGDRAEVTSGAGLHVVRLGRSGPTCSCPWYAQHGTSRGPCKHVLAVELVLLGREEPVAPTVVDEPRRHAQGAEGAGRQGSSSALQGHSAHSANLSS